MSAQKQIIYADAIMDDAVPGTIAWLSFGQKGRLTFSMGADKPFLPAEIRCHAVGAGAQIDWALIAALPHEKDDTIVGVDLMLIKDTEGRWHTLQAIIDRA